MSETPLLDLYKTNQKTKLLVEIANGTKHGHSLDLSSIFTMLSETTDIEIIGLLLEYLLTQKNKIYTKLIHKFKTTDSERLQLHILTVLCQYPDHDIMAFVTEEYIKHTAHRPYLRNTLFKDKKLILMQLTRYVEEHQLNLEEQETVMDLLSIIPRETFTELGEPLGKLKIYSLYQSIPPEKRYQGQD